MRKGKLILAVLLLVGIASLGWVKLASAQTFKTGDTVSVQGEPIDSTLFTAGRTVAITSDVNGDVFCAGQTVTITGTVHGDVMCAGQTITISGKVDGDVRLAGQTVTLDAQVGGNATVGSQTFTLTSAGKIGGDLSLGSTDAILNGTVGRDVSFGGSSLTVSGTIGRNLKSSNQSLTITSVAVVNGDVTYTSAQEATISSKAQVKGTVSQMQPAPKSNGSAARLGVLSFSFVWFLIVLALLLVTSMVLVLLFPQLFHEVTDRAMPTPWRALLAGFIFGIAAPTAMFLLAITLVGIPLAILVLLIWILIVFLSGPVFAYYLGRLMLRRVTNPLLIMLVGSLVLIVLYFVPIVGLIAFIAVSWIGVGMLVLEILRRLPRPAYNLAPATTTETKLSKKPTNKAD